MKKISYTLLLLLSLISCKPDDEPTTSDDNQQITTSNQFIVDSEEFTVNNGLIRHTGCEDGVCIQKLHILSDDFSFDISNDTVNDISGTGNGVSIILFSNSENEITGTYEYSDLNNLNTFELNYGLNYNLATDNGKNEHLTSGTLTITESETNEYKIELTGTDNEDNEINLSYLNDLLIYRYDSEFF